MTKVSLADLRSGLYGTCASQDVGYGGAKAAALVHRRDIRPPLLSAAAARRIRQLAAAAGFDSVLTRSFPPLTHGLACAAQVMVWQVVSTCHRIPLAAETGMPRGHIATLNLTFAARKVSEPVKLAEENPA